MYLFHCYKLSKKIKPICIKLAWPSVIPFSVGKEYHLPYCYLVSSPSPRFFFGRAEGAEQVIPCSHVHPKMQISRTKEKIPASTFHPPARVSYTKGKWNYFLCFHSAQNLPSDPAVKTPPMSFYFLIAVQRRRPHITWAQPSTYIIWEQLIQG